MAVLIEAISVIVRAETILKKIPGGWDAFSATIPNKTMCSDNEIVRVGFMSPQDVAAFIFSLEQKGLIFLQAGTAMDLAVADQHRGLTTPCDWLEYGHIDLDPGITIAAGRLKGSLVDTVYMPDDWVYERSLSVSSTFVASEDVKKRLEFLYSRDGFDYYLDKTNGKEVQIARTSRNRFDS